MAKFLDLPGDIKLYIYRLIASHARVIEVPGARKGLILSSSGALLQTSKTVYDEYHTIFWKYARLDLSDRINAREGKIDDLPLRVSPSSLRSLKVNSRVFAGAGAMKLLKSLSGLKQLLYYGDKFVQHMPPLGSTRVRYMDCACNNTGCSGCMLKMLKTEIN